MPQQLPLLTAGTELECDVEELRRLLLSAGRWLSRREICRLTAWDSRRVRAAAEAAGTDVVRGPRGFAAWEVAARDLSEIEHCARIFISQGQRMIEMGLAYQRRLHHQVG